MVKKLTFTELLKKAIQREIESQGLYRLLSQKVIEPAAKDAFQELVRQEEGHQEWLERYLRGEFKEGTLDGKQVVDHKLAEHLEQPKIAADMKLEDTFLLAANREKASHQFYLDLAEIHPAGKVKGLLKELAEQELRHKRRVELLYTEVAFPQTDGG